MADVEIRGRVSVDTGESQKSINDLNKQIKESRKAMNDAAIGSEEYAAAQTRLKAAQEELNESTGNQGGAFGALKEKLGATVPAFKGAEEGGKGLLKTFQALLANPIVLILAAIVAALALLYKAFTNSFEGGEKMEQIFAGIKAAGQALIDNISRIGTILKDVFTFNFSGAVKEIKAVGDAAVGAFKQMADLKKEAQQLEREQATNDLEQAKRQARLAILREQANDADVSPAERKKALLELKKDSEQNAKDDIDLANRVADNKIKALKLPVDGEKKNFVEIQKIRAEAVNVETENANELRRIDKQITAATKAEIAERKAAQKEADDAAKERLAKKKEAEKEREREYQEALKILRSNEDKINKDDRQYELDKLRKQFDDESVIVKKAGLSTLKLREQYLKQREALEDKYRKEDDEKKKKVDDERIKQQEDLLNRVVASRKAAADAEVEIERQKAQAKQEFQRLEVEGLSALGELIGKQTAVGKGLAIAETTISTYTAAQKAYQSQLSIPTPDAPVRAAIAAGIAIASGLARVKGILSVQVPGAGSGSGGSSSTPTAGSAPAPIVPIQRSTSLDANTIQAVGNAASQGVARVFVLDADVKDNAERNARINRAARLG